MSLNNTLTSVAQAEDTTRTVAETTVAPGGTTTVTVSVEFEDELELDVGEIVRFDDELSQSAADIEHIMGSPVPGAAGPNESRDEYSAVWNESADSYSISYELTVPETADIGSEITLDGAFDIAGTVESVPGATITIEEPMPEVTGVELRPADAVGRPDDERTLDLVVTGADEGIGSYNIDLSLNNTDAATFLAVELTNPAKSDDSTVSDDSVTVEATLSEDHDAEASITIAEITLDTGSEGEGTDIDIDSATVSDPGDEAYDIEDIAGASLTVTDGPPRIDESFELPRDLTGDGLYEDIDGDGELTINDVQVLFEHINEDTVQENSEYYDFSDLNSEEVNIFDVQALFKRLFDQ